MLRWRGDSRLWQIRVWYRSLLSSATFNFKFRCCLFLKFICQKLSWLLATETTNKGTSVFVFIGPQNEVCKPGRLVSHLNYLGGAHTVTTPDEPPVTLCWPVFLKRFAHTGKCQPEKVLMPGASPVDQGLHQLWRSNSQWLKVPPWCPPASQHLGPALFSVPHLCAPTQEGRTDRHIGRAEGPQLTIVYSLFSLQHSLLFSSPTCPHPW